MSKIDFYYFIVFYSWGEDRKCLIKDENQRIVLRKSKNIYILICLHAKRAPSVGKRVFEMEKDLYKAPFQICLRKKTLLSINFFLNEVQMWEI